MTAAWFSRVGSTLDPDEKARIVALVNGRSVGRLDACVEIEVVAGVALSRILVTEEHDSLWWDAEESERERLWEIAAQRETEAVVALRLSASDDDRVAIRDAAALVGRVAAIDLSHIPSAIETAMLSLHQNALAELAGAPADHWFRVKHALFETGRWPLGFRSGRLHIV